MPETTEKRRKAIRIAVILLIFLAGFLLRLNYAAKTDIYTRQHDIGRIGSSDEKVRII